MERTRPGLLGADPVAAPDSLSLLSVSLDKRLVPTDDPPRAGPVASSASQLTAFFTSAAILVSSSADSSFNAKAIGHMVPSSRLASG